jgi:5'-deoxynucleotidase
LVGERKSSSSFKISTQMLNEMDIVKLFSVAQGMSAIQRYSQLHLLKSESVMEHTGFVCLFTYILCNEINSVSLHNDKLDVGVALQKAIVHDIDEVVTGDIPRPTKYYNKESEKIFNEISEAGIDQIIKELEIKNNNMKKDWQNSKKEKEGLIVAFADLSSVIYKLWEEIVMIKNMKLFRQSEEVTSYLINFEKNIKEDSFLPEGRRFTIKQKYVIYTAIEQLYSILHQIAKMPDPIHGTFRSFEAETIERKHGKQI